MRRIREIIIVEGRYDKNAVSQVVDATIVETSGFGVFSDKEKITLLRMLAEKRGLILLTDSDGAGFLIRGKLIGMLGDDCNVKHAYIPDIEGTERRKAAPSKEGKLGVEGMPPDLIIAALERAGATFEDDIADNISNLRNDGGRITKADMYAAGLSGTAGSAEKRDALKRHLQLPAGLSANSLLDVLNILYSHDEFLQWYSTLIIL